MEIEFIVWVIMLLLLAVTSVASIGLFCCLFLHMIWTMCEK